MKAKETILDQILLHSESTTERRLLAIQGHMKNMSNEINTLKEQVKNQQNDRVLLVNALISMSQRISNLEKQLSLSNTVQQQHSSNSPHRR